MYKLIRSISFLIRVYFCYLTIDNVPILENPLVNHMVTEVFSLYTLLWAVTYFENGLLINKYNIYSKVKRAIIYFVLYCINLGILYYIMKFLTKLHILPIKI